MEKNEGTYVHHLVKSGTDILFYKFDFPDANSMRWAMSTIRISQ